MDMMHADVVKAIRHLGFTANKGIPPKDIREGMVATLGKNTPCGSMVKNGSLNSSAIDRLEDDRHHCRPPTVTSTATTNKIRGTIVSDRRITQRYIATQNPKSCKSRRKLHCLIHRVCGFGCQVNTISNCLMLGYALNRTTVVTPRLTKLLKPLSSTCHDVKGFNRTVFTEGHENYQVVDFRLIGNKYKPDFYPPAVPEDLFKKIRRHHDNPFLWWTGQISSFVFRITESTYTSWIRDEFLKEFKEPTVGVHVRRTDKLRKEASLHTLDEYMVHVERWFKNRTGFQPKIFLATDDLRVLEEISEKYPNYKVLSNVNITMAAAVKQRKSEISTAGIIHDIYLLSKCDFVVCTFTSNNPESCGSRRKLHCLIHRPCGLGCQVNTIANCLMIAYALNRTTVVTPRLTQLLEPLSSTCKDVKGVNRTDFGEGHKEYQVLQFRLITNKYKPEFYPPAVPEDLFENIRRYHDDPFLWWTAQVSSFVFRITESTYKTWIRDEYMMEFQQPVVGLQVRRTDKLKHEAELHTVDEYMVHVERWFTSRPGIQPKVFLATDEPSVLAELMQRYPRYKVISNVNFTKAAAVGQRKSMIGTAGIIHDIYLLSKCDFVVCTFTSNVCRLTLQLLTAERGNVSHSVVSLDKPWFFWGQRLTKDRKTPVISVKMPTYPETL